MQVVGSLLALLVVASGAVAGEAETPGQDRERTLEEQVRKQGEELEKLRKEVQDLRGQERVQLEKEVAAYLENTSGEVSSRSPAFRTPQLYGGRVRIGGYMSLELRDDGEGSNVEFDFHRLILKLGAQISDAISFETEIEIEGGGADVSFLTGNEILVEYAEIRWEFVEDKLIFVAGALLVPWGRFNHYHDDPYQDLTDRPLVARRIAAVAFDQSGIGFEGTFELGRESGWFFDYDVAVTQGFAEGFSTNGGTRGARQSFREDNNDNKQLWGRFVFTVPVAHRRLR